MFFILWQLLVMCKVDLFLNFKNLPSPLSILKASKEIFFNIEIFINILESIYRIFFGFTFAIVLAILLVLLSYMFSCVDFIIKPIIDMHKSIPLMAYIPIVSIIFKTTNQSILAITFLAAFFPIFSNIYLRIREIPNEYLNYFILYKSSTKDKVFKLYIPYIIPAIYSGSIIGISSCWMGVITAETLSGTSGIGNYTWMAFNVFQYDKLFLGIVIISFLGYSSNALIELTKKVILKKYFYES